METGSSASEQQTALLNLTQKKEEIEKEIADLWHILNSNGVGMNDALVDAQDYPRSDIDVYQVRMARSKIRTLQTDHTSLMRQLDAGLGAMHESLRAGGASAMEFDCGGSRQQEVDVDPFVRVDTVHPGSPADLAGLHHDDKITRFGSVTSSNFRTLQNIAEVVKHSNGRPVTVKVLKNNGRVQSLSVTPKTWAGRGLLGCNILIIDSPDR